MIKQLLISGVLATFFTESSLSQYSNGFEFKSPQAFNIRTAEVNDSNMVTYIVAPDKTIHIISPEPILYVDISSPKVEGNMPEKNIFRFKPGANHKPGDHFQVTIVTDQFIMAYKMYVSPLSDDPRNASVIRIKPNEALLTNVYDKVGKGEFDRLSLLALSRKRGIFNIQSKQYGMKLSVGNIYVIGDFILLDLELQNKTNLPYDIDGIRFRLVDKRQAKAHVSQEIDLRPIHQFYKTEQTIVKGKWRNIYLFRKFTYPGEKVLNIEFTEKQLSGRKIDVDIEYNQVLQSKYLL